MQAACRVAMVGWFLFAACAKGHVEQRPAPQRRPEARDAGTREPDASARPPSRGEAGSRNEPASPAAPGGEDQARVGATAIATLAPTDVEAAERGDEALRGSAKFRQGENSVDLTLMIRGCASAPKTYPLFVLEGSDCSEATLLGPHWERGESITGVQCVGTPGTGRLAYGRSNDLDAAWSIGGSARSNLLGHAFAIYDPDSGAPLACGVIELDRRVPSDRPAAPPPSVDRAAPIAGLCTASMFVRDSMNPCPDPNEIVKCTTAHCDLNDCVAVCSDYLDCLGETDDPCSRTFDCDITAECAECYGAIQSCSLNFCADLFACAAPTTPDGPCSRLEACCALQGDEAAMCLDVVQAIKKLSGDPSCIGAMQDRDFFAFLKVPCEFE